MREAYRAVEQTEIGADMVTGKGVRKKGERNRQHGSPRNSYEKERYEEQILVVDEED